MERAGDMESWQIFAEGIPRGRRKEIGRILGLSEDTIGMWCRETFSGENPTGTGALNPIDRLDTFFDFCLIHSPAVAEIIATRYQQKLESFYAKFNLVKPDWRACLRSLIQETSDVIQAAAVNASEEELEHEIAEAMAALRKTLATRRMMSSE
jgi:hypothetical protein